MSKKAKPAEFYVGWKLDDFLEDVIEGLIAAPRGSDVTFYLNSGGGSCYDAYALVEMLRLREARTTARVLSMCGSAALLIFAACAKRYVSRHSVFLFHPIQWSPPKHPAQEEIASWLSEWKRLEASMDDFEASMFGDKLDRKTYDRWVREHRYVSAAEMVGRGLAEFG